MYEPEFLVTQKNPLLNRPSEYKPPGVMRGNCPRIQNKAKQKHDGNIIFSYLPFNYTPYSKMAANKLFFCLHVN